MHKYKWNVLRSPKKHNIHYLYGSAAKPVSIWRYRVATAINSMIIVMSVLLSGIVGVSPYAHASGHIVIDDCSELQLIGNDPGYPLDGDYTLEQDIPCEETTTWNWHEDSQSYLGFEPIGDATWGDGDYANAFTGTFDGQGHNIAGMYINRGTDTTAEDNVALFTVISGESVIKNLHIEDINIHSSGSTYVGSLAAVIRGSGFGVSVENVTAKGTIEALSASVGGLVGTLSNGGESAFAPPVFINSHTDVEITAGSYSAGFIGQPYGGVFLNSSSVGNVSCTNCTALGGFAGYVEDVLEFEEDGNTTVFENSFATGDVICYGDTTCFDIGGFAGEVYGGTFANSYATGNVSGNSGVGGLLGNVSDSFIGVNINSSYSTGNVNSLAGVAGGLIGKANREVSITHSYATGNVSTENNYWAVGGLVGWVSADGDSLVVTESFARGDIRGGESVGGLVGLNEGGIINNSYATGNVSGSMDYSWYIGGLVGHSSGIGADITNSYSTGLVVTYEDVDGGDSGGLVGWAPNGGIVNSFYDTQTSGMSVSAGGTSKTTLEMQSDRTYTDVDFSDGLDEPWDFVNNPYDDEANDDIWFINPLLNGGYPCLSWQGLMCGLEGQTPTPEEDQNGDGIFDIAQPNVQSIDNPINNKQVVLEVDEQCEVTSAVITEEPTGQVADTNYSYPGGLVNFTIDCGTPGFMSSVLLYFYDQSDEDVVLRKYNPNTDEFFSIDNAALDTTTINDQSVVTATYEITDGGLLDIDGLENGIIEDPVGLAVLASGGSLANTGIPAYIPILFGSVLATVGILLTRQGRRRKVYIHGR